MHHTPKAPLGTGAATPTVTPPKNPAKES
uniref:Uncharacterized protein n=1 Tax=Arundo donax TaxID=35708 RepID=A0A0A9BBC1_ARUDO